MKKRVMPAVQLVLKPSYFILGCYSFISILTCLSISLIPMPIIAKILLVLWVIAYTVYILQRDIWMRLPWSWQKIEVTSEGVLRIYNQQGDMITPELASHTYIHPYLTVLNLKQIETTKKANRAIVITPWQVLDKSQYRQLRVWLKWW